MTGPILTTARLTLTPAAVSDYDDLARLWSDTAFTRFISPGGRSPEDVWMRLLRDIGHWSALGYGNWSLRLSETGDYVGSMGVFEFRRAVRPAFDAPELGWGVAPAHQSQGLALEALEAAVAWCDTRLKTARTVCMIDPGNLASLRLAGRAGFAVYAEGVYHEAPTLLLERRRPSGLK